MDYYHEETDTYYRSNKSFRLNGFQHPSLASMSKERREQLGFVPVQRVGSRSDSRYYNNVEVRNGATITITAEPKSVEDVLKAKREDLASLRYQKETAGIDVNGIVVKTDRQSQAMITGASLAAKLAIDEEEPFEIKWLSESGPVILNAQEVIGLAQAVRAHVQACFDNQIDHLDELHQLSQSGTAQDIIDYDIQTGWPEVE